MAVHLSGCVTSPFSDPEKVHSHFLLEKKMSQIYAILFTDGVVKVGRGKSAKDRIAAHSGSARLRGAQVKEFYFVDVLYGENKAELELIGFAESISKEKIGYEWFKGIHPCLKDSGIKDFMLLIAEKYSDRQVHEKEIAKEKDRYETLDSAFRSKFFTGRQDSDWTFAWETSAVIESIYGGWGFHGKEFEEINGKGASIFRVKCALYLYQRIGKFNEVFTDIFFNEYEAFNSIMTDNAYLQTDDLTDGKASEAVQ
jgi:hypothetical protein